MGQLKVIERNDQRVLTSSQLAESYGTDYKAVSKNFTRNKQRYVEGKHYFLLHGQDRHDFMVNYPQIDDSLKHAKHIYLWTAKGALLHAKSLGTDKAWTAYEQLVDDYFNKVEQIQRAQMPTTIPSSIEDILIMALGSMKDMKQENAELKQAVRHLEVVVDNEVWLTENQKADIQAAVKTRMGQLKSEHIDAHFQSIFSALNTYYNVPKYDKIPRKDFGQAVEFIRGWFPKKKETTSL